MGWVQETNCMATKTPRSHTRRFFFLGSSDVTSVAYLAMYLVTLEKISILLIQTSHFKLHNMCIAVCSNVSTYASNRRAIDMNMCFTSVFFKTGMTGYAIFSMGI
jgi:hypothetical protein